MQHCIPTLTQLHHTLSYKLHHSYVRRYLWNVISKWLRSCNDCILFGIIWRGWSQAYQWFHPISHTTGSLSKKPKAWKHGKFYKDSLCMRISARTSYPVLFNDQLAVILGNQALHHWHAQLHLLHIAWNVIWKLGSSTSSCIYLFANYGNGTSYFSVHIWLLQCIQILNHYVCWCHSFFIALMC